VSVQGAELGIDELAELRRRKRANCVAVRPASWVPVSVAKFVVVIAPSLVVESEASCVEVKPGAGPGEVGERRRGEPPSWVVVSAPTWVEVNSASAVG